MSTMQRAQSSKRKWRRELLAFAEARRVDEDHLVLGAEVIGLRRPHVAGHQQAGPEHHRLAATADLNPHRPQRGVDQIVDSAYG